MATQNFTSVKQIRNLRSNISKQDGFIKGGIGIGKTIYTDSAQSIPMQPLTNIGIVKGNKLYSASTNAYGVIASPPILEREKIIGYISDFATSNVNRAKAEMDRASLRGARAYMCSISLDDIYWSMDEWNSNPDSIWANVDDIVNYAYSKFDYLAFRIITHYDDTKFYLNRDGSPKTNVNQALFRFTQDFTSGTPANFNGDMAQDQWGFPMRVKNGWGHATFFKKSARDKMSYFVQRVFLRYANLLHKVRWCSFNTTPDQETGMTYDQNWDGTINAFINDEGGTIRKWALYDFHPDSLSYWHNTFLPQRYSTIDALNLKWQTDYDNFSEAVPPRNPASSISNSDNSVTLSLANNQRYIDWHEHNFNGMFVWLSECVALMNAANPNISPCFEPGSVVDEMSKLRMTQNLPRINKLFKIIKTQFQGSNIGNSNPHVSTELIRPNWDGSIDVEVNENDIPTQSSIHDTVEVQTSMKNMAKSAYLNGADVVFFISSDVSNPRISTGGVYGTNQHYKTLDVIEEIKTWLDTGAAFFGVQRGSKITQNVSDRIINQANKNQDWLSLSPNGNDTNRVDIILVDDIGNVGISPSGASNFEFLQQSNGNPLPSGVHGYGYSTILACSHARLASPVYSTEKDKFARVEYWLKKDGVTIIHLLDTLSGFHPNFFPNTDSRDWEMVWDENNSEYSRYKWIRDWCNNFSPFGQFFTYQDRVNNHKSVYDKKIISGDYILEAKNIGEVALDLEYGIVNASQNTAFLPVGNTIHQFELNISQDPSLPNSPYKINFNHNG